MSEERSKFEPQPAPHKTSAMAVIALVLAVLPMCVPLNLTGSVLGMVALARVKAAGGQLRGRRAARVAIWGGIIASVAGWWAWTNLAEWGEQAIHQTAAETTRDFLKDAAEGRPQAALARWSPSSPPPPRPSEGDVVAFGASIATLGEVKSVGIVSMQPMPGTGIWQPLWSAWLDVVIGDAHYDGSAQYELQPAAGSIYPRAVLRQVLIDGPEGDVSLPPGAVEPAP